MPHIPTPALGSWFEGGWIGETQNAATAAHEWNIYQHNCYLDIRTRWQGEWQVAQFVAEIRPDGRSFEILDIEGPNEGVLLDDHRFIIKQWVLLADENGQPLRSDVIFTRKPSRLFFSPFRVIQRFFASN